MTAPCDILIPVKNTPWWLALCLEELFRNAGSSELASVLVIDDGSDDDLRPAIAAICAQYPAVKLVRNDGRHGFGGAINFGMRQVSAPNALLLNTDCLITRGTIAKLVAACAADASIGMACPLSNNSPVLTLPLPPGRSYIEVNALLERAAANLPPAEVALDCCTVVGNCLLITRACWEKTGEFDEVWKQGYGEESDYQMRAIERGFRGVALTNTYVFHFGGGTFQFEPGVDELRARNHQLFLDKWGARFHTLLARHRKHDPVRIAQRRLDSVSTGPLTPDVLFVLPGLAQGIGGVHLVLDLCNYLVRHGVDARCAIVGALRPEALAAYREPIFCGLLHFPNEPAFLKQTAVRPKCLVTTLYSTVAPAYIAGRPLCIPLVSFVQGYECFFENGKAYNRVVDSYAMSDQLLVTSEWLRARVAPHAPAKPLALLPIGVETRIFQPRAVLRADKRVRVGVMLRHGADKGQWVLLDVLSALFQHTSEIAVTVFAPPTYELPRGWEKNPGWQRVALPLGRAAIAAKLAECDIFLDASMHEGFGLMPLEAMACGATVVISDSGGVNQYLRPGENGVVVREINKPERYVEELLRLARDPELLARLRSAARATAQQHAIENAFARYVEFFKTFLAQPAPAPGHGPEHLWEAALEQMSAAAAGRVQSGEALSVAQPRSLFRVMAARFKEARARRNAFPAMLSGLKLLLRGDFRGFKAKLVERLDTPAEGGPLQDMWREQDRALREQVQTQVNHRDTEAQRTDT
jgi:GT2 family glycosyltransferase